MLIRKKVEKKRVSTVKMDEDKTSTDQSNFKKVITVKLT